MVSVKEGNWLVSPPPAWQLLAVFRTQAMVLREPFLSSSIVDHTLRNYCLSLLSKNQLQCDFMDSKD